MKSLLWLPLFLLLFLACTVEDDDSHVAPPTDDTVTFTIPATRDIVMYEVNLRALSTTGDLQGVINRLDHIKALGINVIWLMPIHPIGEINSVNSPYSVKNYKEVNPEFGTLATLKTLVKEAHRRKMAVILDWVANHTAWDNPWIVNKDWYTQDGSGNIISPPGTNWDDVADLDYSSLPMRLAMIDAMKYWIVEADIDGFRCDAADMVPIDFWMQAIDSVNGPADKNLVWLAEGGSNNLLSAGFQINYSWNYYSKLKDVFRNNHAASSLVTAHEADYAGLQAGKQKLRFTTNHDESAWDATPMVIFGGEKGALAASVAAICLGGVPLIYSSQEVGTTENVPFFSNQPINWSQHPAMLKAYKDILGFYNQSGALRKGEMESFSTSEVLAFTKISEGDTMFVIDNVRGFSVTFAIPDELVNTTWQDAFSSSVITLGEEIELEGYEYVFLSR